MFLTQVLIPLMFTVLTDTSSIYIGVSQNRKHQRYCILLQIHVIPCSFRSQTLTNVIDTCRCLFHALHRVAGRDKSPSDIQHKQSISEYRVKSAKIQQNNSTTASLLFEQSGITRYVHV